MENIHITNNMVVILIAFLVLLVAVFLWFAVKVAFPLMEQRQYILMEMERAETREEYDYWKSRLIILYLQQIPFIHLLDKYRDDDD